MSNNNTDEDIQSIKEIKEIKKKNKLTDETKKTRANNLQKAREQHKINASQNKNIIKVENELKSLFNNNKKDVYLKDLIINSDIEDEEENKHLDNKKNNLPEKTIIKENKNNDYNDDKLNKIYEKLNQIDNINKRVEKLYMMKKSKPVKNNQPIIINNEHKKEENNKSIDKNQDLINSLKNRMFNN